MLSLSELKGKLLRAHREKTPEALGDEYQSGFLAGLESVLLEIDRAMESEEEGLVREFDRKEK